jgi:hypothetical protein
MHVVGVVRWLSETNMLVLGRNDYGEQFQMSIAHSTSAVSNVTVR